MKISHVVYTLLKWILSLVQLLVLLFAGFLVYIAITDYDPPAVQPLRVSEARTPQQSLDTSLSLITWNVGYGGLGKEMDFFYDDGHRVRPTPEEHHNYIRGIEMFLTNHDTVDFFLLQEVDKKSKRSWQYNQVAAIRDQLPAYYSIFCKNYDVPFVPLPPTNPMGKVKAGMMTLSKNPPDISLRLAFPEVYSWPMKHFMLDRAAIVTTHTLLSGKKLMVINVHNSAYVDDSLALQKELDVISRYALKAFRKGYYVIIGGDWNQNPPNYHLPGKPDYFKLPWEIDGASFGERWQWAYDSTAATNRRLSAPLNSATKKTSIDFYALSPNIRIDRVEVLPMNFSYSDHEPVYLEVTLIHR